MRRWSFAAAFVLVAACALSACWDSGPVQHPTGVESPCETQEDAAACEQGVCIQIPSNKQNMSGMCSAQCEVDADCTPHEHCASTNQGSFCFRTCLADADCYDAFVCRIAQGTTHHLCFVDAN